MSSTGGCRRPAKACARASRTIASGSPTSRAHYVATTGDRAVLDEPVPFLEGPQLAAGEHDAYFQPMRRRRDARRSSSTARARSTQSLALGAHGLPLIGTGDWNDGMNRVGERRQGRERLARLVPARDARRLRAAGRSARRAERAPSAGARTPPHCRPSLERDGWDGAWYRRAYFDDGTPLGSAASDECRIDSIAQSWAVISGAADPARAAARHGRRRASTWSAATTGLALLFTPPFDRTPARPRLHQGLPARHPRERRPVHPRRRSGRVLAFAAARARATRPRALFSLLNPINHAARARTSQRYKVEPYVVAADVYSVAAHVGRGGWTWYTGSAGWMYRAGIESILGFARQAQHPPRRPLHPHLLAPLRDHLQIPRLSLRHHRRKPTAGQPRHRQRHAGRQRTTRRPRPLAPSWMTAQPTPCA